MHTLVEILTKTEGYFRTKGIASPRLEAELILSHVLKIKRLQLYLDHDRPMQSDELESIRALVARRGKREPLSWILGERGFHNVVLNTGPNVLDPRPDTETLVEAALGLIPDSDEVVYVADIGCGSGAIGLSIAAARSNVRLYAIDISREAVDLTRSNVQRLRLESQVAVLHGDLLAPVPENRPIDIVVSNPPYIRTAEIDTLQPEVSAWEPRLALDGGADGLAVYRRLIPQVASRARRDLLLEVGHDQAAQVTDLLRRANFSNLQSWKDLAGIHRVVGGRSPLNVEEQTSLKL